MSSTNTISSLGQLLRENLDYNHAGARVPAVSPETKLERMVLACLLWEKQFYMDGEGQALLVKSLVAKVDAAKVAALAIKARDKFKLRHIPLLLTRELARIGKLKAETLEAVVQRPDEMGEFMSLYWAEKKQPLSNQVKKGLASAFVKFNEYQLAKWNKRSASVSLRDVMFLCHPKPATELQASMFQRVAKQELETPDTWETALSAGADKKETFTRLMVDKKLGALAFLRNLRNMLNSEVSEDTIRAYGKTVNIDRVLPFRYVAAARIVPQLEDMLEDMMLRSLSSMEKLPGKTALLVDVSGSMFGAKLSEKSDLDRFDAAAALAMLCKEVCEGVEIYTFSNELCRVAPRSGFALKDALYKSQSHSGTHLGLALDQLPTGYDRIIVFTDEQSQTTVKAPNCKNGYVVNVAAYENGINHSAWTVISGFSEAVIDYIQASENSRLVTC
jgi:hypothetical protein